LQFWKQFFESAAGVSLSGYEELVNDDTTTVEESTVHDETSATYNTPRQHGDDTLASDGAGTRRQHHGMADESLLTDDGGDLTGSTPRPPATKSIPHPQFADLDSEYENLRREIKAGDGADTADMTGYDDDDMDGESTESQLLAERTARLPDMSMTPRTSLDQHQQQQTGQSTLQRANKDPLLHRVLDKNYRIQSTPHRAHGISPIKWKVTDNKEATKAGKGKALEENVPLWQQDSPMSSPEMAVPKLRSEAFMSPIRAAYRNKAMVAPGGPRTPGVSVQTPATARKTRDVFASDADGGGGGRDEAGHQARRAKPKDEITWESDSDEDGDALYGGMSPPKTIQFALPPSKLLQTPGENKPCCQFLVLVNVERAVLMELGTATEASKRIVENILFTAGAAPDESSEYSPTMVKMNPNILDDTF